MDNILDLSDYNVSTVNMEVGVATFTALTAAGDNYEQRWVADGTALSKINVFSFAFDNVVAVVSVVFEHTKTNYRRVDVGLALFHADGRLHTSRPLIHNACKLFKATVGRFAKLNEALAAGKAVCQRSVESYSRNLERYNELTGFNVRQLVSTGDVAVYSSISGGVRTLLGNVDVKVATATELLPILRLVRAAREQLHPTLTVATFADVVNILGLTDGEYYVDAEYLVVDGDQLAFAVDDGRPLALSLEGVNINGEQGRVLAQKLELYLSRVAREVARRQRVVSQLAD